MALKDEWGAADRRRGAPGAIWHEMLSLWADQVFTIGIVSGRRPARRRRATSCSNVPERGIYNFDPGAFFGIYRPTRSGSTTSRDRREREQPA